MSSVGFELHHIDQFVQLLLTTYAEQKQIYSKHKSSMLITQNLQNKKQGRNQQKTRSKSRKSKQIHTTVEERRSSRISYNVNQIQKFMQLDKQPLWHPKCRRKQLTKQKIKRVPVIKIQQKSNKIKKTDPLYEFYSQYEGSQNQNSFQKPLPETDKNNQIQEIQKQNQPSESEFSDKQLQNWTPTKRQSSMLAIQTLIDEYIIFKQNMRNSNLVKVSQLVNYIREIKGYYFNITVLQNILTINPKLYKLFTVDKQKYIRCGKLNTQISKKRHLITKIKMKRLDQDNQKKQDK